MSGPMDPERLARLKHLAERAVLDRCEDWGDPEIWRGLADWADYDFDVASYLAASRPETVLLLLAEAERLRGERDDAQRAHIRSLFGSGDHVMARSGSDPFAQPVRCTTHEQVAAVFGWTHLYDDEADAPEGEQAKLRAEADRADG